jgi:hypothetical protein
MIQHAKLKWPADKPAVASVVDGLTSNLTHLTVLCFLAKPFYFDCNVKLEGLDRIRRAMDQSDYDDWESTLHEDGARMFFVTSGAWFRFESRKLGQAIYTFLADPNSAAIHVYMPFLKLLQATQEARDMGIPHHRTMNIGPTVVRPQDERDRIATRFATLIADEFEMLKEALGA